MDIKSKDTEKKVLFKEPLMDANTQEFLFKNDRKMCKQKMALA